MKAQLLELLGTFPMDVQEQINVTHDMKWNEVICVETCGATYMGDNATRFLADYAKLTKSTRKSRAYAKRDPQEIDLDKTMRRVEQATRDRHAKVHVSPMTDIDQWGPSYDPLDWTPPHRIYMSVPATEAGGAHDPATCFVPKRTEAYVWNQDYLDPRGRYAPHW
jgi:hypothetical protein